MLASAQSPAERIRVGGILHWSGLVRLGVMNVPDRAGLAAAVLCALGNRGVNVPFVVQSVDLQDHTHIVLCVAAADGPVAAQELRSLQPTLGALAVVEEPGMALVSVFGPDFRERPGIAGAIFSALASAGINIRAISTSISTVSCLIREEDLHAGLEALRAAFVLP